MIRGGFGIPYRPPAPGSWPKILPPFTDCFQHVNKALNGIPKYVNSTSVTLQPGQVGRPVPRPALLSGQDCETTVDSPLPAVGWIAKTDIGISAPLASWKNTYTRQGTNDLGAACRLRGFKNVQAVRQWHGRPGFLDYEFNNCADTSCSGGGSFRSYQDSPNQTKYLRIVVDVQTFVQDNDDPNHTVTTESTRDIQVDPMTGITTINSATDITHDFLFGVETPGSPTHPPGEIDMTNCVYPDLIINALAAIAPGGAQFGVDPAYFSVSVSRTDTVFSYTYQDSGGIGRQMDGDPPHLINSASGTFTLSVENTAASVLADVYLLLAFWDLTDDGLYPWRTDGVWQVAPLVSRYEYTLNVSLSGGQTAIDHYDGDTPVLWVDPNAGLYNGKILGMPVGDALSNGASAVFNPDFSVDVTGDYQDYFDFNATQYRICPFTNDEGTFYDLYVAGYGEWLYDAITRTGAQLPHCATAWTNNADAISKRPYAWLVQGDGETYDKCAQGSCQPSPDNDFHASRGDALWAQKCAEIIEPWSSYDFARPGGADKFNLDESLTYCVAEITGSGPGAVIILATPTGDAVTIADASGVWGGASVGGFYNITWDGSTVTLGTKVFNVPTGWSDGSDDDVSFGKLRFDTAPGLLGRAGVSKVTDVASSRLLTVDNSPYLALNLTAAEGVDICAADMTVLASNVTITRLQPWAAGTVYAPGVVIIDGNGNAQRCTTGGTSDASAPVWAGSGTTNDNTVVWTFALAAVTADTTFAVASALVTIAAAKFIVAHGATSYEWDDNQRKGDFTVLDWLLDSRTNGEGARLAGITDCDGNNPPAGSPAFAWPPGGPFTQVNSGYASFNQTQYQAGTGVPWSACKPYVVCLSPNGETWVNGQTIAFPVAFNFDDLYGARWQMEIEAARADFLWQTPHVPCGSSSETPWVMDDGSCTGDYAHAPLVESRIAVPTNGGAAGTDVAPALPSGITIGYVSPLDDPGGLPPPGQIGFDGSTGNPVPALTIWGLRLAMEQSSCPPDGVCAFNYVALNNLACTPPTVVPPAPPAPSLVGLPGLT